MAFISCIGILNDELTEAQDKLNTGNPEGKGQVRETSIII